MHHPIRVLVVDDSPFMRRAITRMISSDAEFEVVGYGANGQEALDRVAELAPDVVTLDIEMPVMDGLTALRQLHGQTHVPVIMMSTLTQAGAHATFEALEAGAFDFVPKPQDSMLDVFGVAQELRAKLKAAASGSTPSRQQPAGPSAITPVAHRAAAGDLGLAVDLVAVGISTGGPRALQTMMARMPADFPVGMIIVQHMPPGFTRPLAQRLNDLSPMTVREAEAGDIVSPGVALIAPAGMHLVLKHSPAGNRVELLDDVGTRTWHKPSVDVTMASVALACGAHALGLIMTGMGNDGTSGAKAMKDAGATIWAQDEATSVVYGMPRSVAEAGIVDRVLGLDSIPLELARVRRHGGLSPAASR